MKKTMNHRSVIVVAITVIGIMANSSCPLMAQNGIGYKTPPSLSDTVGYYRMSSAAAEDEEQDPFAVQVIPPSPQSTIYQKYLDHKVDECTGIPAISIPLYEIQLKELTIPITLSYHASGVKAFQYDGDVGAGWSVNVGGYKVLRTIYGLEDECYPHYDDNGLGNYASVDVSSSSVEREVRDEYLQLLQYTHDSEYDHFSYILPTTSGEFILQNGDDPENISALIAGPQQDIFTFGEPNEFYAFRTITITDDQGTVYTLGNNNTREEAHNERSSVVGWPLNRMTTRYQEEITFEYEKYVTPLNARKVDCIMYTEAPYYINYIPYNPPYSWWIRGADLPYVKESDYQDYNSMLISKITTPACSIHFIRRKISHNDTDNKSKHLISAIEIYDVSSNLVRRINFDHILVTGNNNDHNLLQKITIEGNNSSSASEVYSFTYYDKTSGVPDLWGYGGIGNSMCEAFKQIPLLYEKVLEGIGAVNDIYTNIYDKMGSQNLGLYNLSFNNRYVRDIPTVDYSLKRITYPTGGFTEYEYEPHSDDHGYKIGGLRIKRISSKPEETASAVVTEYQYADAQFELTLGSDDFVDDLHTIGFWHPEILELPHLIYSCARTVRFSTSPTNETLLGYRAQYGRITKLRYNQKNEEYGGKTVSIYGHIPIDEQTFISTTAHITPFYNDGSYNLQIPASNTWSRVLWMDTNMGYSPVLTERIYYDTNEKVIREENYSYTDICEGIFKQLRLKERIQVNNVAAIGEVYDYISFRYDHAEYDLKLGFYRLSSKTVTDHTDNGPVVFYEDYLYNQNHRITRKNASDFSESYLYPEDLTDQIYRDMVADNILAPVIELTKYDSGESLERIAKVKTQYGSWNGIYVPVSVQSSVPPSEYRDEVTFDRYDNWGNIVQTTTIDGISTVYIWGYYGQYPIAKIENATFEQLISIIPQTTLDTIASRLEPSASDLSLVNSLRSNAGLAHAAVSTYTYQPLVGMLTATDPAGIQTSYEYDALGRLIRIRDGDGHIVEEYEYHYMSK